MSNNKVNPLSIKKKLTFIQQLNTGQNTITYYGFIFISMTQGYSQ